MNYPQELESLYQKSLELKSQNRSTESDLLEVRAADLLKQIEDQIERFPENPDTAALLLYLAEREWAIVGDHTDVLDKIQQALALREKHYGPSHPLTAEALTQLAEFHFLAGRLGEAEVLYRRALPHDPAAAEGFARTLAALGRPEEAETYFVQAIETCPGDAQGKRSLYFLLIYRAEGLEKLGRGPEAQGLRGQAAALLPRNNPGEQGFHV